jgi:phosphatidate cytidylyltransferase
MKSLSNFQQRFLMSFLGIALLALIIFSSHVAPFHYLFVAAVAIVQYFALSEFYTLAEIKGFEPLKKVALVGSLVYIFLHYAMPQMGVILAFLFALMLVLFCCHFPRHNQAIGNLATTLFGIIYVTIPLGFFLDINFSSAWIIYLLVVTKITDTFAYCSGKLWGNRRLAPVLSPKKTLEGAVAGLIGAVLASIAFSLIWQHFEILDFSVTNAIILGFIFGLISQIGDLAESLLKRDAEVKDSNNLPGFGGMLDVVDSLLFTTPLLYFWLI